MSRSHGALLLVVEVFGARMAVCDRWVPGVTAVTVVPGTVTANRGALRIRGPELRKL
ncbi:hypothetical protein [Phytoactinopolyspora halotolerans]|uniref:Uncharacterized protein n=1 Tax=Phytoactinopolyspora halotolerans TaxID=1981512 RepID=A0A6L9S3U7_9ACTN|nr:hypothetical protein [Phytoactinopolyspora halotolerans]NED99706.1 hypothetical protein [Phytoactinopolyspora halotolerans]